MCRFNNPIPLILVAPKWSQNAGFCRFLEGVSYWDGSPGFRMELYNHWHIMTMIIYIYIIPQRIDAQLISGACHFSSFFIARPMFGLVPTSKGSLQ